MNHNKHNNIYDTPSPLKRYTYNLQSRFTHHQSSISNTMYFLKNIRQNNVFHTHVPNYLQKHEHNFIKRIQVFKICLQNCPVHHLPKLEVASFLLSELPECA